MEDQNEQTYFPAEITTSGGLFRRLTTATFNYGIGGVLSQIIGFVLIPVYTAYLSPDDYGQVELATSLVPFLVILMRMGVPSAVTRFYFDHKDGPDLYDYVTTVHRFLIFSSISIGVLAVVVLLLVGDSLVPGLPFFPFVVLVAVTAAATGNIDLQRRLIQAREQSSYSAKLSIVFAVTGTALAILFVVGLGWGAKGMVLSGTVTAVLFFLQAQYYLWQDVKGKFRLGMLGSTTNYAMGALPAGVMGTSTPLAMRSLLSGFSSVGAVGLFGLANRFTLPLAFMGAAFNRAYFPVYCSVREEATSDSLSRLAAVERGVWLAGVFMFLGAALLGPPAVELLTPERFHPAASLVPVLAGAFLARSAYNLLAAEIFYSKNTPLVSISSGSGLIVTLGIVLLTVREHGALGVAWAMVVGEVVRTAIAAVFSMRMVPIPHDWVSIFRVGLVAGVILAIGLWLPGDSVGVELVTGSGVLVAFLIILRLSGDTTLKLGVSQIRGRLSPRSN